MRWHVGHELTLRWMSAAILIPFGLCLVYLGGHILLLACGIFAGIMAFEWGHISGSTRPIFLGFFAFFSVISYALGTTLGFAYTPLFGVILGSLLHALLSPCRRIQAEGFNGLAYAVALAWSLYILREGHWNGLQAALIMMPIVWASDAAGFFMGKLIQGPSLSKQYSPRKTWSGALSAIVVCMGCGLIAAYITGGSAWIWLIAGAAISLTAQMGDLFESIQKRRLNVKDASGLIPGHGGFMDRVDGLGAMCFCFVVSFVLFPALPASLGLI